MCAFSRPSSICRQLLIASLLFFPTGLSAALTGTPSSGALVLVGGGEIPSSIATRFVSLAGGPDRNYVYIPTAAVDADIDPVALEREFRTTFGVSHVKILHTRDREIANRADFIAPLERADAVWFGGGRQWRIADAYLGTRTEAALHDVLRRGGVIGGTSAGASILASFLVRGAPEGNRIVEAPSHVHGFGLLAAAAVDQHVDRYHREDDIAGIVQRHPDILGIGLDESTAVVIAGGSASVIGAGRVILHDSEGHGAEPYLVLHAGDHFAIGSRFTSAGKSENRRQRPSSRG
jgi:cyanophycinase